ncbi:putative cytochrome p450 [Coleophoma cylindrospora]|uniref:Putative cytochrome p450 n=1 Tax=Coleophoma cylindrospora TaxID=1849047 RepID=A0A3D8QNB2_9HELO|nr:putative cytochrome p450 [Coleophoma cylindrospora]
MFGLSVVFISDEKIAEDLLVKRAKIYSDRPAVLAMADSKSTHGSMEYLPLMGKNQHWSRQRKWAHGSLKLAVNPSYESIIDFEVQRMLFKLSQTPENFQFLLEDMPSKVACTLAWDDPDSSEKNTQSARDLLFQISPSGAITNRLPMLWYLPLWLNPWKRAENARYDALHRWWVERLEVVSKRMKEGAQRPCWALRYLSEDQSALTGSDEAAACVGMMSLVSVLTIGGPLQYFTMAMVHNADWLKRCQEEIDQACNGRMPSLSDAPKLPILRACIKETMRWRPNVPTGVAHELQADNIYQGYFIPKGTKIVPLECAFLRNPLKYPDPETFRPERWLEPSWPTYQEPLTQYPTIKGMSSFGWGQRTCLGQSLTEDVLLAACGGLCWNFNLKFKMDFQTKTKIDIPTDVSNSLLIIKPDNFAVHFEPRRNGGTKH